MTRATAKAHWADLFREVVSADLCTGCAGCVIACPHDVLSYDATGGRYKPVHLEASNGSPSCSHGERGCTSCTRACPRFRSWEPEIDASMFGRSRDDDEMYGVFKDIVLTRATDVAVAGVGQDGGVVSAILVWALEHGYIDGALVSGLDGPGAAGTPVPVVARNRAEVLAAAGSRYTYSANLLAYRDAVAMGAERLGVVGMGCMSSAPRVMGARRAGKVARRFALNIGLLCSKTFDDSIYEELVEARYGVARGDIVKVNIKGALQVWATDGRYLEIPLKECHAWTRQGCTHCPDFSAQHADISTGGIGAFADWTLTIVRTDLGREVIVKMLEQGVLEGRPGDDDPGAIALLRKLSVASRRRWPGDGADSPARGVPPKAARKLAAVVTGEIR